MDFLLLASPMADPSSLDLRDIEIKLGRKVPESLARSLREEPPNTTDGFPQHALPGILPQTSTLDRLETKIQLLRQDMVSVTADSCVRHIPCMRGGWGRTAVDPEQQVLLAY